MSGTPTLAVRSRRVASAAAWALAVTGLAGCADLGRALTLGGNGINVESPTAGVALAAARARYVTPHFSEVPPVPHNIPSPAEFKRRVGDETADRAALDHWVAAHPQMTAAPEDFAVTGRAEAAQGGVAPDQDNTAAAEDWAARVRASAVPPPPPQ